MKLRANIIEKRGTLQVIVSYKDSNGKIRQKWKDTKLKGSIIFCVGGKSKAIFY
ncbi:hypothetical protein KJZ24_16740 [Enterococcus faecalis]|uniref:hypothetical protein n=1 Tax=Enterococcus faecalis TaxID=1351 RepID=UPI001E3776A7|nr:hypothetical protein [Enterococcus faecalis]MCE2556895.1 hypothetical protein [Enterococcus faecalis]